MKNETPGGRHRKRIDEDCSFPKILDAIAQGVEARLQYEQMNRYSRIISARTMETARKLSLPEDEIQQWLSTNNASQYSLEQNLPFVKKTGQVEGTSVNKLFLSLRRPARR